MGIRRVVCVAAIVTVMLGAEAAEKPGDDKAWHKVVKIIDGDTITVQVEWADYARLETVRLIGVDAPERSAPYAPEALTWLKNLLKGEEVRLEYSPGPHPERDRYGRILAYVYRGPDGFDVNLELVKQGYAELYRKARHRREDEFTAAADHARRCAKGIWPEKKP